MNLDQTLQEIGVGVSVRHPDIKPLARRPVLHVLLDQDSEVASVDVIPSELATKFWTIRSGNFNSFPQISLKKDPKNPGNDQALRSPLTAEEGGKLTSARKEAARLSLLNEYRNQHPINLANFVGEGNWPSDTHRKRIRERAKTIGKARKAPGFVELARRFLAADPAQLLVEIERCLYLHLSTDADKEGLDVATALSFGGGCNFLFDCEMDAVGYAAASPQAASDVSLGLTSPADVAKGVGTQRGHGVKCALTGKEEPLVDDKFPEANLPLLGPTFLHAKNEQTPCTMRYGFTGPDSMPVSRKQASILQASAEELTRPERKNATWRSVPSEKPKSFDLLIAFIDKQPDARVADGLVENEADFNLLGERSCKLLDGRVESVPASAQLEVLVIRRLDLANKKVIYRASYSVEAFAGFAREWSDGQKNVPDIRLFAPSRKKGEKPFLQPPGFISPGNMVGILRRVHIRGGREVTEAPGPTFADTFRLLTTREGTRGDNAARILSITLSRAGQLLAGIAHCRSRSFKEFQEFDRLTALDVVSLLGLLLSKLGHTKDNYMNELPFLLGQLLAGADTLHRGYCADQRGGAMPPSLLGNALLLTAGKNPCSALAQLGERWKVYHGWADKTRTRRSFKGEIERAGKESPKARELRNIRDGAWIAMHLQEIAKSICVQLGSAPPDDPFKAKLLLGYLAGFPKPPITKPDLEKGKNADDTNEEDAD